MTAPNLPPQIQPFGTPDFRDTLLNFIKVRRRPELLRRSIHILSREEIACGGTAFIHRLRYSNGFTEIEKSLSPRFQGRDDFEKLWIHEFEILKGLTHPLIVRALQMRERESLVGGPTNVLVLEYIEGVNLSQLHSFLSELPSPQRASWASEVLRQLVSIASYLRRCGVVHGDLAPENLILQPSGLIKLVDFGVARRECEPQHDFKVTGRLNFRAPELRTSGQTTYEGDVFAIGKIYEHLLGEENSALEPHAEILKQILEKRELPRLDLEQGWFRGVQPMPPAELLQQRAVIRAKTKILKLRKHWMTRERLNALILVLAFPFLTSWLPQLGTLTINSLPSSMVVLPGATSPLATPLVNIRLPAGRQRLQFIIQSQQNRRVIREISIQPNEHLKLFEDFRKN